MRDILAVLCETPVQRAHSLIVADAALSVAIEKLRSDDYAPTDAQAIADVCPAIGHDNNASSIDSLFDELVAHTARKKVSASETAYRT